ncbi:MAG: hypothetical protein ACRDY7_17390 [Acidimicrobiia bacterium]
MEKWRWRYVRLPLQVDGHTSAVAFPAPLLGQHTHEVLSGLGYGEESRAALIEQDIIAAP